MLDQQAIRFDGESFDGARDGKRLQAQLSAVRALMSDGECHSLAEIAAYAKCSTASASARCRDMRKLKFGGHTITRHWAGDGIWLYRMVLASVENLNGSAG